MSASECDIARDRYLTWYDIVICVQYALDAVVCIENIYL